MGHKTVVILKTCYVCQFTGKNYWDRQCIELAPFYFLIPYMKFVYNIAKAMKTLIDKWKK